MYKKKTILLSIFALCAISLGIIVSAQSFDLGHGVEQWIDTIKDIFEPIASVFFGGYDNLLEKTLIFLIIFCMVYISVNRVEIFSQNKAVEWVIVIAVSLLAARFLGDAAWLKTILLPYSTLGVAISAVVPFIIYLFFIESFENSVFRKIAWIFLFVVFIWLWFERASEIGNPAYVYLVTAIIALIFFFFDKTLHTYYIMGFLAKLEGGYAGDRAISDLRGEILNAQEIKNNPNARPDDIRRANRIIKNCKKRIKMILKE